MALKTVAPVAGNPAPDGPKPTKSVFAEKVAGSTVKTRPKPIVHRGAGSAGRWVKILTYGHTGTGKTFVLVGLLKAGLKLVVLSTDIGGSGLESVFNELTTAGLGHLADNIIHVEFPDYDSIHDFFKQPESLIPDIWEFDPDFLVWDGFSGFQQVQISNKIMSITPQSSKVSEGRDEGLWKDQQDWGMIRDATLKSLSAFLAIQNWKTGKAIHKYMTCLEQKPAPDKLTSEIQRAPFLQGSAASLVTPAFDIIMETRARTTNDKDRVFEYYCQGHDKLLAKSRGFDLAPIEPADMYQLWTTKIGPKLSPKGAIDVQISDDDPER